MNGDMNAQKQRKIIMMVNGEKKEVVFNDNDKGSESKKSSSKRKSTDSSSSSTKRTKSSDKSSSSSLKHKSSKDDKSIDASNSGSEPKKSEKSSSSSSKHKSSKKHSSLTEQKSDKKDKSTDKTAPTFKIPESKENGLSLSKQKSSSSSKHKSTEKSSSVHKSDSEKENKSGSKKEQKTDSEKEPKTSKKDPKHSEKEQKSSEQEPKTSDNSKSKHRSSSKSKEKSSDQSSESSTKHSSSSSRSKSEKSSSSSKRSRSSEKSSSSHSKRRKSSDKSKNKSIELNESTKEFIKREFDIIKEENIKSINQLRDETKKMIVSFCQDPHAIVPESAYADRTDLDDRQKRSLAIINAPPYENYPDEDYDYIYINGEFVPKCKFEYFVDPKDNIFKFRKIADFGYLAEHPFEKQSAEFFPSEPIMATYSAKSDKKVENEPILVQNTEIPLQEINDIQQNNSQENIKVVSIKSEILDDEEVVTTSVTVFSTQTTVNPDQCPTDSKANLIFSEIKSEAQPHCSKNIPISKIKEELSTDSKEYFRIIPQNSTNSEISVIEDFEKLKTLADMSLINKWMASQNKNHGFKDKVTLNLMMSKNSLFSLFKCMGINCCYTTISYENFLDHLNIHVDENVSTEVCFLNCAYCLNRSAGPIDLIEHYKNVHFNCTYQCSLCFYRAAEQQSVFDHQAHYHSQDTRKREIFECPNVFPKDEKLEEQKAINKVKGIKECLNCELCFEKFIIPEDYVKHLKSSHQSIEEKDKSEEEVKKMNIDFANNRIGKYQCLECDSTKPFGSNSRIEMRTHLHQHPRTLHYVCVRETDQYKHMRIKSRGDIQITKYNGDLEVLRNTEGILKITTM